MALVADIESRCLNCRLCTELNALRPETSSSRVYVSTLLFRAIAVQYVPYVSDGNCIYCKSQFTSKCAEENLFKKKNPLATRTTLICISFDGNSADRYACCAYRKVIETIKLYHLIVYSRVQTVQTRKDTLDAPQRAASTQTHYYL